MISYTKAVVAQLVGVGAWLSLGILRTEAAWSNFLLLGGGLAVLLLVNQLVLRSRESLKRHKRAKAQKELMGAKLD